MQASSVPTSVRQRIQDSLAGPSDGGFTDESSGYVTVSNSWASTHGFSSLGLGPERAALAWSGVRHEMTEDEKNLEKAVADRGAIHCSQAVLLTCLHLSHEMALRDVGLYAWTIPVVKDPTGSMMRIMRSYAQRLRDLSTSTELNVRTAPDPSKASIQNQLQKARLAAGLDSYVAVLYSGHGIQEPPTEAGEIWCYDRSFEDCAQNGGGPSEYIPILLFDVLTWAGAATCYVWDCQYAGRFLRAALTEAAEIDTQLRAAAKQNPSVAIAHPAVYFKRQIHFAACGAHQILPRVPGMPDDLFTACLTTPLQIALLHHNLQTFPLTSTDPSKYIQKSNGYMAALLEYMSDSLKNRLWSELQAILNTIAWQTINGSDYQMLFGQSGDVVSSLAAGFLLSQRVMGAYRANPESIPAIPSSTSHALWTHWDLILDNLFEQLPPYFEEDGDQSWEADLKLVSFMDDQLASILESDLALFAADVAGPHQIAGLSRLPIICKAALTPEFRARACIALDTCLRELDIRGLTHAIQGGALDVAAQLLAVQDDLIAPQMISIWSSLVRHDACVAMLARHGRTVEKLTSLPCVKFFLDSLESNLTEPDADATAATVRCAAVLATIANYVTGRDAPRFTDRTLHLGSQMLVHEDGLVKEWGALLIAEVVGSINRAKNGNGEILDKIKSQLLDMTDSYRVENRATSVFALSRWIDTAAQKDVTNLLEALDLSVKIGPNCRNDSSALVRKETVALLQKVLIAGGRWTKLVLWIYILGRAGKGLPAWEPSCIQLVQSIGTGMDDDKKTGMKKLNAIIRAYDTLRLDPNVKVAGLVNQSLSTILDGIKSFFNPEIFNGIVKVVFPTDEGMQWEDRYLNELLRAGERLLAEWESLDGYPHSQSLTDNDLFEESKASLQMYLAEQATKKGGQKLPGGSEGLQDRAYALRYRILEDSMVIASQQVDLPWHWKMAQFPTTDPWSTITFHSFTNTAISCSQSHDLLMWSWNTSKKTDKIHLDLPRASVIESAKFVNELFDKIFVLAEISNGDIHVLSSPPDEPVKMKTVSSFHGLQIDRGMLTGFPSAKHLASSWWRQSGKLAVGGMSDVINVWDCPAERCNQVLSTNSTVPITTLITEPVSGNLLLGGFADGIVKLWDMRQADSKPILQWVGESPLSEYDRTAAKPIIKLGVVLGESRYITSACANGLINVHDLRNLISPTVSTLVHPHGISSASFQAHSGLMSTTSLLRPHVPVPVPGTPAPGPSVDWALHRSHGDTLTTVSSDTFTFDSQTPEVATRGFQPYTVVHYLRPFLGVGYGRNCFLRGAGRGTGDDTESGSYSFLRAQMSFPN